MCCLHQKENNNAPLLQHKWYCPSGIHPQGQTVRQAYYAGILKHLWDCVWHKCFLSAGEFAGELTVSLEWGGKVPPIHIRLITTVFSADC